MNLKRHCQAVVFISLVSSLAPAGLFAAPQLNEPGALWTDDRGWPINAHGGGLLKYGGKYYWYGEYKVGETILPSWATWECYRTDVTGVSCYSSKDLLKVFLCSSTSLK